MFFNIQIDLLILKTYDGQFTLATKKKSLHIIFKLPPIHLQRVALYKSSQASNIGQASGLIALIERGFCLRIYCKHYIFTASIFYADKVMVIIIIIIRFVKRQNVKRLPWR